MKILKPSSVNFKNKKKKKVKKHCIRSNGKKIAIIEKDWNTGQENLNKAKTWDQLKELNQKDKTSNTSAWLTMKMPCFWIEMLLILRLQKQEDELVWLNTQIWEREETFTFLGIFVAIGAVMLMML